MYLLDNGRMSRRSQEEVDMLRQRLRQDAVTGVLYWTDHESVRPRLHGEVAGCVETYSPARRANRKISADSKSIRVNIGGKKYSGHQIAWILAYGYAPDVIDHFDGNGLNNRIGNLRDTAADATDEHQTATSRNLSKKRWKVGKTGERHVYYTKAKTYAVRFADPRLGRRKDEPLSFRRRTVGTYDTLEEAVFHRDQALSAFRDPLTTFIPPIETNEPFPGVRV